VFVHRAVVRHIGAAQATGRRFDWRYQLSSYRNHMVLLSNNLGISDPIVRRYVATTFRDVARSDPNATFLRRSFRLILAAVGLSRGLGAGLRRNGFRSRPPRRLDKEALMIRTHLQKES